MDIILNRLNRGLLDDRRCQKWSQMSPFLAGNLHSPQLSQLSCGISLHALLTGEFSRSSRRLQVAVCDVWCWIAVARLPSLMQSLLGHPAFIPALLRASMRLSPESWRRRRPRQQLSKRLKDLCKKNPEID